MIRRTGVDVRDYVHSSIFEKESGIPLGGYPQTMYYRSSDRAVEPNININMPEEIGAHKLKIRHLSHFFCDSNRHVKGLYQEENPTNIVNRSTSDRSTTRRSIASIKDRV